MEKPKILNSFKSMKKLSKEAEAHYADAKWAEANRAQIEADRVARSEQYEASRAKLLEADSVDHDALAEHDENVAFNETLDERHQEGLDNGMDIWLENGRQHLRENPKLVKLALKLAKQDGVKIKR